VKNLQFNQDYNLFQVENLVEEREGNFELRCYTNARRKINISFSMANGGRRCRKITTQPVNAP
jgi:hypothetical protein